MFKSRYLVMACALIFGLTIFTTSSFGEDKPIRVLYLTKSSGFEHSVVRRDNGALSHSEKIMLDLAEKNNMQLVATKDASMINKEQLQHFDVVQFYTTGQLTKPSKDGGMPMSEQGLKDFIEWVKNGGGFAAMHTGSDNFHNPDFEPYNKLVGGIFKTHGRQEKAKMTVKEHPITSHLDSEWELLDEYYIFRNVTNTFKPLLILETKSMEQDVYNQLEPYAITWIEEVGKGRVFSTALGHREDVWTNPDFQKLVVKGIQWAANRLK